MDPSVKAVGGFGIDRVGVQNQAAERHLDMAARTAEAVIEVEVAKGGIKIVAPEQADDPPAKPHAFRVASGTIECLLGLGKFIDFLGFLGAVFGGVLGTVLGAFFRRRGLLVGRLGVI